MYLSLTMYRGEEIWLCALRLTLRSLLGFNRPTATPRSPVILFHEGLACALRTAREGAGTI
jgi:hypothetical protein